MLEEEEQEKVLEEARIKEVGVGEEEKMLDNSSAPVFLLEGVGAVGREKKEEVLKEEEEKGD